MRIIAIDPSLKATGLAFPDRSTRLLTPSKYLGAQRLVDLEERLKAIVCETKPDVVAIEGYSYGSKGAAVINIGEWGGVLRAMLWRLELDVVEIPPANLKKFVTGRGNTPKQEVFGKLCNLSGEAFPNDNQADAWGLAAFAYGYIGEPWIKVPAANCAAWGKVEWPDSMVAARAAAGLPAIAAPVAKAKPKKRGAA